MGILFKTSMVFDAISLCWWLTEPMPDVQPLQREIIEEMEGRLEGDFPGNSHSHAEVCGRIYREIDEPSALSLEELAEWCERNGLSSYADGARRLAGAGFDSLWRERILPAELAQIARLEEAGWDDSALLADLAALKNQPAVVFERVEVCLSLMAYPISFQLGPAAFLYNLVEGEEYIRRGFPLMVSHELMHGFASPELIGLYGEAVGSVRWLESCHRALIDEWRSGDEEEMVLAAEYLLAWRQGILDREEIERRAMGRYGGCVPLSLAIFARAAEENVTEDYNQWLTESFRTGILAADRVKSTLDRAMDGLRVEDERSFYDALFLRLRRCGYALRFIQSRADGDPAGLKELLTGGARLEIWPHARREEAFRHRLPCRGSHFAVPPVTIGGEEIGQPWFANVAYDDRGGARAEFSVVCGRARCLLTVDCADEWGEILAAVKNAGEILDCFMKKL